MFVVAGGSGRTGAGVADALLAEGQRVRVILRAAEHAARWHAKGAEVAVISLEDADALRCTLEGAEAFYALIPEDVRASDLRATRRAIVRSMASALRESAVGHVVLLSASAAVLPDGNGPAAELHDAERALAAATHRLTILRAGYFQENVAGTLAIARASGVYPCFFQSADLPIPMVSTADVSRLAATCLRAPAERSETVDLIGPAYSATQVASLLGARLRRPVHVHELPAAARVSALLEAGLPHGFAMAVAELHACLGSERIAPRGDRIVAGTTPLEETLAALTQSPPIATHTAAYDEGSLP